MKAKLIGDCLSQCVLPGNETLVSWSSQNQPFCQGVKLNEAETIATKTVTIEIKDVVTNSSFSRQEKSIKFLENDQVVNIQVAMTAQHIITDYLLSQSTRNNIR